MPTTTMTMTETIGADTPIWDAEFAARWEALQASSSSPSPKAAPVKRKPRRTPAK